MLRRFGFVVVLLAGCASARPLVPLHANEVALDFAFPSVFVAADPPLRVPSVVLGGRYGVTDDVELRLTWHPMHLLFDRTQILGLGLGGVWHVAPADGWAPGLHFTSDLTLFAPLSDVPDEPAAIVVFDAAVIAHWEPFNWAYPYLLLDVAARSADVAPITSAYLGVQLWPKGVVAFSLEAGWFGFSLDSDDLTVPYIGPGYGMLYLGAGASFRFGGSGS